MNVWNSILKRFNENLRNKYQGTSTDNNKNMLNKIESGKTVSVYNPTSLRTFTKGSQGRNSKGQFEKRSYTQGNVEIGDTTSSHKKKDYAKTEQRASSSIKSAEYNPNTNTAKITFRGNNKTYDYNVTPDEFNDFLNADSKGRHVANEWNHNPHFRKEGY